MARRDSDGMADGTVGSEGVVSTLSVVNDEPLDVFLMDRFLSHQTEFGRIPFSSVRLVYIYHIFNKVCSLNSDASGREFVSAVNEIMCTGGQSRVLATTPSSSNRSEGDLDCLDLGRRLGRVSPRKQLRFFKILEKASRGQAENAVWHALRIDTISATRFYDALASGCVIPSTRLDSDRLRAFCEGIQFGARHEPVVKALIETYVVRRRESVRGGLGVLLDPSSGILGASLDLCFGVGGGVEGDETITVGDRASIFEIKCRFKYLRSRDDPTVERLLKDPSPESLAAFLQGHPVSAVEYRETDDLPSGREFLLSRDEIFRGTKRGRPGVVPDIFKSYIERLIRLNEDRESLAIVFDAEHLDEKDESDATTVSGGRLRLYEKGRFDLPAFVNPRHPYYCQTLVQQYVLSQYYIRDHPDPERIHCKDLPSVSLVSAVLRKRSERESACPLYVGDHVFECDSIPLFIIVTPVVIDPVFARDAVTCVLNLWKKEIGKRTGLPLWVLNAANEYLSSSVPRPPSP